MKVYIYKVGLLLAGIGFSVAGLHAGGHIAPLRQVLDSTLSRPVSDKSVVDEVVCVVGDEPILKSDIEVMKLQAQAEGVKWKNGNGDGEIMEQIAVQKLFLHQAALDSIDVPESEIAQGIDQQIDYWISMPQIGSKEKLEEFQRKSLAQIRQDLHDDYKNRQLMQKMQEKLVSDIKVSPSEVREYFKNMPSDSLPVIPTMVEVQILTQTPRIEQEEINRIKNELRSYTERVTKGETSFQTLASLYSQDPGSARRGGELGYMGRGMLDPAFAAAAFNLTDPQKLSKVVESEFGYHIIQFVDRRGDKVNCRHILLKPRVSEASIEAAKLRLDSIGSDIRAGKFTFDGATAFVSDDKDTKNNHGLMVNSSENSRTSRFKMKDLPTEVAQVVETMEVGDISAPFQMVNEKGKTVCAIVKLKSRIPEHRATITEDFQAMKDVVVAKRRQEVLHDWIVRKIKDTYVSMNPRYKNSKFEYEGWVR
ncbi:peptidylprolyl isomerase [Prevotella dentasini]|uniref:peptidylprolyl isomerase n=1 Tax=Prevotella dentasini TaxID=589537 RepID=UPI000469B94C|nr:peptidylprolyl isomerase [Prevotella dentasini]